METTWVVSVSPSRMAPFMRQGEYRWLFVAKIVGHWICFWNMWAAVHITKTEKE